MRSIDRRAFLKSAGGLVALAALDLNQFGCSSLHEPIICAKPTRGPNERINLAVIGLGGRSQGHLQAYSTQNNCRILYVCDPDTAKAQQGLDRARASNGDADAQFVTDLRRIVDDKNVDAVSIVTPNHWHALAAIWAMQAGKDVYLEKPVSHNLSEGRKIVDWTQRTGCVCQAGTQMRSNPALVESIAYLREGNLGKVLVSRALCYKPRGSIGKVSGAQQPPSTVDYDIWCGPAPLAPVMRTRFHYDWHWIWDFGNGDIGNQGVHELDIARWAINANTHPRSVQSVGGRFGYVDDGQTPNTQIATFDYGPGMPKLIAEVRGLETAPFHSRGVENVIECEKGFLVSPTYTSAVAYDRDGNILRRFDGGNDANHFNNFVDVVRSRKMSDLHAPILEGHLSAALMHLANISFRLGKQVPMEPRQDRVFADDSVANEALEKTRKHLADNRIPMQSTMLTVGRKLSFDPKTEKFADADANRMGARDDRKPFTLPA
jgi:predicted dehydrogenase